MKPAHPHRWSSYTDEERAFVLTVEYLVVDLSRGQFRRDGRTPVLVHFCMAAQLGPQDAVSQAVLLAHDIVEDGYITLAALREHLMKRAISPALIEPFIDGVDTLTIKHNEDYHSHFIPRIRTHRDGKWVPHKAADIRANLSDDPTPSQCVKYGRALVALYS